MKARLRTRLAIVVACSACFIAAASSGSGATSATVVGANVLGATSIDVVGCPTNAPGITEFGPVVVASNSVTTGNCTIEFGSSNSTAQLRLAQSDGFGSAMYRVSHGAADSTFASAGVFTHGPSAGEDVASSVAVQRDGRIVVAGLVDGSGLRTPMIIRLDSNGAFDGTFGTGGARDFPALVAGGHPHVAIDAEDRLVLAFLDGSGASGVMKVVRLLANGDPDPTFGTAGVGTYSISGGGNGAIVNGVAIDSAGRPLVLARAWAIPEWGWYSLLVRVTEAGVLDTTFAGDGGAAVSCPGVTSGGGLTGVVVAPDGSMTVAGSGTTTVHVARFTSLGAIDGTFGASSGCTHLPAPSGVGGGIAIDSDGGFVVGTQNSVSRLLPSGLLDTAFGTSGATGVGGVVRDVAVDVDGSILASWAWASFRTTRLSSAGVIQPSHGVGGTAAIVVGNDAGNSSDMALAPDGRILQVGRDTSNGTEFDFVVLRRDSVRVAGYESGVHDWTSGGTSGVFGACLRGATLGAIADGTTWTSNVGVPCPAGNGVIWRGIPASMSDPDALVVRTTNPTTTTATAELQFGLRTAPNQPPGSYVAPVTFNVIAP